MTIIDPHPIEIERITFDPAGIATALSRCLLVDGRPATPAEQQQFVEENDLRRLTFELDMAVDESPVFAAGFTAGDLHDWLRGIQKAVENLRDLLVMAGANASTAANVHLPVLPSFLFPETPREVTK